MVNCLFWNLHQKDVTSHIVNISEHYDIDIFIFAESIIHPGTILSKLNSSKPLYFYAPNIGCEKIWIFTRFSADYIPPILETDRLTIRKLILPGTFEILLAAVHFPSKLNWKDTSQILESAELSKTIRSAENQVGHTKTILVGDLNMNPFEDGMISASGLHGVMSKDIALKKERVVQSKKYPYFYNPMWGLFGDMTPGPPGTHYYAKAEHSVVFWNMFDQILIRPDLLDFVASGDIRILQSDGKTSLLSSQGIPVVSDHLPLFFTIRL